MKVVHVVQSLHRSGRTRVIQALIEHLPRPRFSHSVWCLSEAGEAITDFTKTGVELRVWGKKPGIDWKLLRQLAAEIRRQGIQLVHSHGADAMFYASLAARWTGIPSLCTIHIVHPATLQSWPSRLRNHLASRLTTALVPVSMGTATEFGKATGIPIARMHVIENGVDWDRIDSQPALSAEDLSKILGAPKPGPIIGTTAMLAANKDYKTLLEAFKLVVTHTPTAKLLIIGDGPKRPEIVHQIADLDLQSSVYLLGFREDVPAILRCLDVFVLSTHAEGLPLALAEAMGCGCPVVVTDVPGVHGVVVPGENGLLIPPNCPTEFARGILSLIGDAAEHDRLATNGRIWAREHFAQSRMVSDYLRLYEKLAGGS